MRAYGRIKTNLKEGLRYSLDYLTFETPDGKSFDIDFYEGDYCNNKGVLDFRVKSLASSYCQSWVGVTPNDGEGLEDNYDFFKDCKLVEIGIFIYEDDDHYTGHIRSGFKELSLGIQTQSIDYDSKDYVRIIYYF